MRMLEWISSLCVSALDRKYRGRDDQGGRASHLVRLRVVWGGGHLGVGTRGIFVPCLPHAALQKGRTGSGGWGCVSLHSPRRMIEAGADPKVPGVEDGAQAQGTMTLSLWVQSPAMMGLAPGEAEAPSACSLPCP